MPNDAKPVDLTTVAVWAEHYHKATLARAALIGVALAQLVLLALPWWFFPGEDGGTHASVWLVAANGLEDVLNDANDPEPAIAWIAIAVFLAALLLLGIAAVSLRRTAAVLGIVAGVVAGSVAVVTVVVVAAEAAYLPGQVVRTAGGPLAALLWLLAAAVAAVAVRWSGDEPYRP